MPNERSVHAYDMHLDDRHVSVLLATVEFKPAGSGIWLVFTEQGVFLDGRGEPGSREEGPRGLPDKLEACLRRDFDGTP